MSRRWFTVLVALAVVGLLGVVAVLLRDTADVPLPPPHEPPSAVPGMVADPDRLVRPTPGTQREAPFAPDAAARPPGVRGDGRGDPALSPGLPPPLPSGRPQDDLPSEPPWMTEDGGHPEVSPADWAIQGAAAQLATASGPELYEHAADLVAQATGGAALVGVAALVRWPEWEPDVLDSVARHDDPAVPLFALQALRDAGRWDEAMAIEAALADRLAGQDWLALARETTLPGTAWRGLLGLAREQAAPERHRELLDEALVQADGDYAGRMHALLELRRVLPFEAWREAVRTERRVAAEGEDALWLTGLQRLEERVEGPVEVHTGPPVMTAAEIDLLTAREYPAMYEDLALRLEFVLDSADGLTGRGVRDRLANAIDTARAYPLGSGEAQAVDRLEVLLERIDEQPLPVADALPPGSME